MKSAIALVALALFPQDTGRVPIAPETPAASQAAPVIAGIGQAREALKAWIAAAEAGAPIDEAELAKVREATRLLVQDLQALHGRARAQNAGKPKAEVKAASEPAARNDTVASGAREIAQAWIDDARALGDGAVERRERALVAVRNALTGTDATATFAALRTLSAISDVQYDKASFRPLVLPIAREASQDLVEPALYALAATERKPEDLALVHAAWQKEPEAVREDMLHLMTTFGDGRLEGRSEEIALELLAGRDRNLNVQFSGLWGARVGPRLEARVLELARSSDHELRHAAIYFGLSTFAQKSKPVIDALVAALADPDPNNSERALWGLGHEVPEEFQRDVAAALVDLHNGRSDPRTRETCARLVKRYGGPELEAKLKH